MTLARSPSRLMSKLCQKSSRTRISPSVKRGAFLERRRPVLKQGSRFSTVAAAVQRQAPIRATTVACQDRETGAAIARSSVQRLHFGEGINVAASKDAVHQPCRGIHFPAGVVRSPVYLENTHDPYLLPRTIIRAYVWRSAGRLSGDSQLVRRNRGNGSFWATA